MFQRILGGIAVVWGGLMLISWLKRGASPGSGAYAAGQNTAVVFGALLFLVGLYTLLKRPRAKK